ncbi:MAG: ATP-binding cassette domain-containing protein, partial [Ruminiclostridium sp.]|nr:ATP-binding cassette domain-containing protein [Ruminiclostridium sp.]
IEDPENLVSMDEIKGQVEFRNVTFSYEEEKVMQNMSFLVKPGQTIGIVGPTGAGKSTLVNLICRFYECNTGEVLIDGINVRNISKQKLRDSITMAMQDTFLFSDTVEGNIAYGAPDAPMMHIESAARTAGAHDFILKLSEAYDTIVGERGVGLSGGQRQRVSLARSLLKDAAVLILDDITSSVDVETEQKIQQSLRSIYSDKTTFIISHRISSVKDCDNIIVLDKGVIVEQGSHAELIANNGYYYNIYAIQSGILPVGGEAPGDYGKK